MKAIVVKEHGPPSVLTWLETPTPTPAAGQVRLKMLATSVNFADLQARRAPYRHFQAPFTPGFDGVGIVDAVGEEVSGLKLGDRVAAYTQTGSYAEYALARPSLCFPWEAPLHVEDGVGIGILITAYNALTLAGRMRAGEHVLIHAGGGGVGSLAIQIAKKLGAAKILTTVSTPEKVSFCRNLGADEVIVLTQQDFAEALKSHAPKEGLDLILDTRGGPLFEIGHQHLAPFGRIVTFGHSSSTPGQVKTSPLHRHNQSIIGYSSGGYRKSHPQLFRERGLEAIAFFKEHQLHVPVGGRFPLEEAKQAHELVESGRYTGKILLTLP